jgi:hypothetical protein
MKLRHDRRTRYPHVVVLPHAALLSSIYGRYRIVNQRHALQSYTDAPNIVRSAEPFILAIHTQKKGSYLIGSRKEK